MKAYPGMPPPRDPEVRDVGTRRSPPRVFVADAVLPPPFGTLSILMLELFSDTTKPVRRLRDPCSWPSMGKLDDPVVATNCASDGLSGGMVDLRANLLPLVWDNPSLSPKTGTTLMASFAYADELFTGSPLTLASFGIEIDPVIRAIIAAVVLSRCYESTDRRLCELILRDETGLITHISAFDSAYPP